MIIMAMALVAMLHLVLHSHTLHLLTMKEKVVGEVVEGEEAEEAVAVIKTFSVSHVARDLRRKVFLS